MIELLKREGILSVLTKERAILFENLLDFIYPVLNEIHNVNFSRRFWKILLRVFINSTISGRSVLFRDEVLKPEYLPVNRLIPDTFRQKLKRKIIASSKILLNAKNRKLAYEILNSNKHIVYGLPAIPDVTNEVGVVMPDYLPNFWINGDSEKRKKLNSIIDHRIKLPYEKQILRSVPKIYVEYFDRILKSIPLVNPKEREVHAMVVRNYFEYFVIAKYVEAGSKLYFYQHGGYYGEIKYHNAYLFESSVADTYRTWGWKINKCDQPWKAYRLKKFSDSFKRNLVPQKKYDLLLLYTVFDSSNTDRTVEHSEYVCEHLDFTKFRKILARPRPRSKVFSQKSELSFLESKPGIVISDGLSEISTEVASSKLVLLFQYPSTTFLECLFVNHPTVAILNNLEPTEQVQKYYQEFIELRVFHLTIESLVEHLNTTDLDVWWSNVISSEVYKNFKENYCRY